MSSVIHIHPLLASSPAWVKIEVFGATYSVIIAMSSTGLIDAASDSLIAQLDGVDIGAVTAVYVQEEIEQGIFSGLQFLLGAVDDPSALHTLSTVGGSYYYGEGDYYQLVVPSVTYRLFLAETDGWVEWDARGETLPDIIPFCIAHSLVWPFKFQLTRVP